MGFAEKLEYLTDSQHRIIIMSVRLTDAYKSFREQWDTRLSTHYNQFNPNINSETDTFSIGAIYIAVLKNFCKILNTRYLRTPIDRIECDKQAKYSLTPLCIAEKRNMKHLKECGIYTEDNHVIVDATASVGGDTMSFMLNFPNSTVYALEPNSRRFGMLQKNVTGVQNCARNETAETECFQAEFADLFDNFSEKMKQCSILYLDPPWGGSNYKNKKKIELFLTPYRTETNTSEKNDIVSCCSRAWKAGKSLRAIVLRIPDNFSSKQRRELEQTPGVNIRVYDEYAYGHHVFSTMVMFK